MVTLKDVAKRANVSKMTVSRVINHPQLVTDELKELVHQAMEELGYTPNKAARALAQNRTMVVKVLILEEMDITEPYFMHLINGIARGLDKYHYALQLVTENTYDLGGSDGFIISGMTRQDYEWVSQIKEPVIIFGENDIPMPFVDSDNHQCVYDMTKTVIQRGYDHLVYVGMDVEELFAESRVKGFESAVAEHPNISSAVYSVKNSSSQAEAFINQLEVQANTCFVCATDRIALGVQRALAARPDLGDNYGITGYDGVFLDQIASPKMTTVKQDWLAMGQLCVELLMQRIEGKPLDQVANYCPAKIIIRDTIRPLEGETA
ncbi:TPA: LacI family DNA-binding transcriptional regulator [Streptococcus suis]